MRILHGLARFIRTEEGDVKCLQGIEPPEFRLHVGASASAFTTTAILLRFSRSSTDRRLTTDKAMGAARDSGAAHTDSLVTATKKRTRNAYPLSYKDDGIMVLLCSSRLFFEVVQKER
jgi:hypothetical protein